jgi:hypothetical protein
LTAKIHILELQSIPLVSNALLLWASDNCLKLQSISLCLDVGTHVVSLCDRLTTNEDILNEFDSYSSRSSDQSFMENNFEIDCNFESQNLCETNCKSKPQEYENCWLNMTGSDILRPLF